MENIVVDTSVFIEQVFGKSPTESFNNFLSIVEESTEQRFYIPPSVFEEIKKFVEEKDIDKKSLLKLILKAPKKHEIAIPAYLLYNLVMDTRKRIDKGLRIAENAVRSDGKIDEVIRRLRAHYREATREGIIDSKEDVDLLLLARELNGTLATADKGLSFWAQELGILTIGPEELKNRLVPTIGVRS